MSIKDDFMSALGDVSKITSPIKQAINAPIEELAKLSGVPIPSLTGGNASGGTVSTGAKRLGDVNINTGVKITTLLVLAGALWGGVYLWRKFK